MCGQVTARQQLEQETNADVILAAAKQGDDGGARGQCHQGVPLPSQPVSTSLQYSGLGDYLQGYSNEQRAASSTAPVEGGGNKGKSRLG
jgi:hypothetical protein